MISAAPRPSRSNAALIVLVFGSSSRASSRTRSLPSCALLERAQRRPSARTLFGRSWAWSRGCGPNATPPPRNRLTRREPCRARPVPFCLYILAPVRQISARVFTLWVPARRLASCQVTTRCRMSTLTSTPKMASLSSTTPTSSAARFFTESCIVRLLPGLRRSLRLVGERRRVRGIAGATRLHRVGDPHVGALGTRHAAAHEHEPALRVHTEDLE